MKRWISDVQARPGAQGCIDSARIMRWVLASAMGLAAAGCSDVTKTAGTPPAPTPTPTPQGSSKLYFVPAMDNGFAATYAIDHTANTFVRKVYGENISPANGAAITDSGTTSVLPNGVTELAPTYSTTNTTLTPDWAVEIPGEAAFIGLSNKIAGNTLSVTPAVPTGACPSLATAQTFQFVTIPSQLSTKESSVSSAFWSPALETAYGSAEISTDGTTVQIGSVSQHTFPVNGKSGTPSNPGAGQASVVCAPTFYGQTIGVPTTVTVIDPGNQQLIPPTATIGIGPSGFLVEDAGTSLIQGTPYENILGAAYGAVGLLKPASALNTSDVASAQYKGFLYGSGGTLNGNPNSPGFSLSASFGYSNLSASCPQLPAPKTSSTLYGGEFGSGMIGGKSVANDPAAHAFGNCDLALDLGAQDGGINGLYPAATVYVTSNFTATNTTKDTYSFPAVAIAGQIQGKYAIFLIGVDTEGSPSQAWGIYLIQSN